MGASLHIRNVDEMLVAKLKARAAEAEHREILRQALEADLSFDALAAERRQTPAEALMREGREER